jgi:succinoglycan biosynthesis transport protein ExoP
MQKELKLEDYLAIAIRRKLYIIIPFIIIAIASVVVAFALPPVYRSTGKILVESQQIPPDLVQSTVTGYADQHIGLIRERIMTRSRLEELIRTFNLYPDDRDLPLATLVARLRSNISVDVVNDPYGRSRAIAFTVSFDYGDPKTADDVADELVNLFLKENVKTRTARASETTNFLKEQAAKLAAQSAAIEAKVAKFKQEHSDTLPEDLNLKVSMLDRAVSNLKSLEREIAAAEEEKRYLETQRTSIAAMYAKTKSSDGAPLSPVQQLAALRNELVEKLGIYTPNHPDIASLKRRIADLENMIKTRPEERSKAPETAGADPATEEINSRIRTAGLRLDSMRAQKKDLEETIERLQNQVMVTPQVERKLKDLTRNYDSAMREYQAMQGKVQQAVLAQNLEDQKKAERFELLEPPIVPASPVSPNKLKIMMLGLMLGLGSGGGAAFAVEMLDTTLSGPAMLTDIIGRHPIVVIPRIVVLVDEVARRRVKRIWYAASIFALVLVLGGGLLIIHVFRQPLGGLLSGLL